MTAIHAIAMPKWGMEMSEGMIADWHIRVGDTINAGDDIVDIETSKIINTLTAHEGGLVRRIVAAKGESLRVGALLGVLADAAISDAEIDAFIARNGAQKIDGNGAVKTAAAAPVESVRATTAAVEPGANKPDASNVADITALTKLAHGGDDSAIAASTIARRLAREYRINLNNISPSGSHGRVSKADIENAFTAAGGALNKSLPPRASSAARSVKDDNAVAATPVARRIARELGINLHDCRASDSRGRVGKADVEAAAALFAAAGQLQPTVRQLAEQTLAAAPQVHEVPLSGIRKTIAARLQSSKQNAPHFRVSIDAELDQLLAVRAQLNAAHNDAKISVTDLLIKACAMALMRVPAVNIQFDGDVVKQFADADISVAVALDNGLITPIVRAANRKGVVAISTEMRDLATRAKLGNLKADEFQGGTFSISNLGMFGVRQFDAIINPPQGAILATGAGEQRAVVKNGALHIATVMTLSLSSDHRVIDGAVAARFMAALKGFIESPATMLG